MDLTLLLQNSHTPVFKNKKQWVRVSNKFGVFEEIISRFSQGSIVGQIWLVLFLTTFFTSLRMHQFITLKMIRPCFTKTTNGLKKMLKMESVDAIKWLSDKKMIC